MTSSEKHNKGLAYGNKNVSWMFKWWKIYLYWTRRLALRVSPNWSRYLTTWAKPCRSRCSNFLSDGEVPRETMSTHFPYEQFTLRRKKRRKGHAYQVLAPLQFSSVAWWCLTWPVAWWCLTWPVAWSCATPWTTARQASLSITNPQSPPKPISIESVMPSNHHILCHPLLLLPSIFPSIRVFSNESTLCIRWPNYLSFSCNISPSNEHPGLTSFRMDWLDLLAVQGTLKSLLQHHSSKSINSLVLSFLYSPTFTSIHDYWENHSFD